MSIWEHSSGYWQVVAHFANYLSVYVLNLIYFLSDIYLFGKYSDRLSLLLSVSKAPLGLWPVLHGLLPSSTGKTEMKLFQDK